MAKTTSVLLVCLAFAAACHRPLSAAPAVTASHSVFTDSVYHAAICEAPRQGEDWRTSCQPRDQRPERMFMAKPPQ